MKKYIKEKNSLLEISTVGALLGAVVACSVTCAIVLGGKYWDTLVYIAFLCMYYLNEFIATAQYQTSELNSKLFMIYANRGNKEFFYVQCMTLFEAFLRRGLLKYKFGPVRHLLQHNIATTWIVTGLTLIGGGMFIRRTAMRECGESFNHIIQTSKGSQKLVSTGIYAWLRHPSYLGFYLFAVGIQIFLRNWISLLLTMAILSAFFKKRIEFEEWFLINRIFGEKYVKYSAQVGHWIPFVVLKTSHRQES